MGERSRALFWKRFKHDASQKHFSFVSTIFSMKKLKMLKFHENLLISIKATLFTAMMKLRTERPPYYDIRIFFAISMINMFLFIHSKQAELSTTLNMRNVKIHAKTRYFWQIYYLHSTEMYFTRKDIHIYWFIEFPSSMNNP